MVRLAALLAAGFPVGCPRRVRFPRSALFLVPHESLAEPVTLHAHVDGAERRGPELRRAERVAVAVAHTLEEVLPQVVGGVPALVALELVDRLLLAVGALGLGRAAGDVLPIDREALDEVAAAIE